MAQEIETAPKRPTPKAIDTLIAEYAEAQSDLAAKAAVAKTSSDAASVIKIRLTAMVEQWGGRHTEKSKRLEGDHNTATTTTGTTTSIDTEAVEKLRAYLGKTDTPALVEEFFTEHTTYSLTSGPDEKLKTLTMGARLRTKISTMLKSCIKVDTKLPSLKVDLAKIEPS